MRVKWVEFPNIDVMDPLEDYHPVCWHFEGEVISTIRSWGTTFFVVMLNEGRVREVPASRVELVKNTTADAPQQERKETREK